jgi:hypothetical protein
VFADRYLREAMFGPERPRASGRAGREDLDPDLVGFGVFGTSGHHCFDTANPVFRRVAALIATRARTPALRSGRQYLREASLDGEAFAVLPPGELIAWSRILSRIEMLCVVNPNGREARGADVVVDAGLNAQDTTFTVVCSTAEAAGLPGHRAGDSLAVRRRADGTAFVEIRDLGPAEALVLTNPQGRSR